MFFKQNACYLLDSICLLPVKANSFYQPDYLCFRSPAKLFWISQLLEQFRRNFVSNFIPGALGKQSSYQHIKWICCVPVKKSAWMLFFQGIYYCSYIFHFCFLCCLCFKSNIFNKINIIENLNFLNF